MEHLTKSKMNPMTKADLVEHAERNGIAIPEGALKPEMIEAILDTQAGYFGGSVTPEPVNPLTEGPTDEHGYPLSGYDSTGKQEKHGELQTPTHPSQNNDAKILTLDELFRTISRDRGSSPFRKFRYIPIFERLNPGFKWPKQSSVSRLIYLQNLAHFAQYKDTLK